MPEAVIVATARSPIGRAFKGSMTSIRPDDLLAQMVSAALAKVPALDPASVEDLIVGCGLLRVGWLLFHWCSPMVRVGSYGAGESCGSREERDTREMLGVFFNGFDGF